MKKLDEKVKKLWLARNLLLVIPTIVLYLVIVFNVEGNVQIALGICLGILVLIIVGLCLIWPFLAYHFTSYSYDDMRIDIYRGVIFRHKIVIPVRQIQDLHLYNGPIMQIFKLSGLIISTAGSNFILSGISISDADLMLNDLELKLERRLDSDEEVQ